MKYGTRKNFDDIPDLKTAPEMLKLAEHIIESKAADFEPENFIDCYEVALLELLKKKQAGAPVSKSADKKGAYVQKGNVFELLALPRGNVP